jgi:hypothetical protein
MNKLRIVLKEIAFPKIDILKIDEFRAIFHDIY